MIRSKGISSAGRWLGAFTMGTMLTSGTHGVLCATGLSVAADRPRRAMGRGAAFPSGRARTTVFWIERGRIDVFKLIFDPTPSNSLQAQCLACV